jgi:predicted RNase H-like nuclease (RuvC/YqgF family)
MGISSFGITFYIILALSVSTAGLGWLSLSLHDDKVEAEQALAQVINVNTEMQKSLNLKDLSCKQDDKDTTELESEKSILKTKVDELSTQISKLKSGIKKPISQNNPEAPKNAEANTILDGTELLSDDLVRMLTESYCLVETCPVVSTGQPVK